MNKNVLSTYKKGFSFILILIIGSISFIGYPLLFSNEVSKSHGAPEATPVLATSPKATKAKPSVTPKSSSTIAPTKPPSNQKSKESFSYSGNMVLTLRADSPYIIVNGIKIELDSGRKTTPIIQNGRTLLPLTSIITILGGTYKYDGDTKKITIDMNNTSIELSLDSRNVIINGQKKLLDVAPQIINQRTMVPIRFIAENCNLSIEWKKPEISLIADYLPEGILRARTFFKNSQMLDNVANLPSLINILTRIY